MEKIVLLVTLIMVPPVEFLVSFHFTYFPDNYAQILKAGSVITGARVQGRGSFRGEPHQMGHIIMVLKTLNFTFT